MCQLCMTSPCDSRCPNADNPVPVYYCKCGEGIYEGDKYFDNGNVKICEECLDNMSAEEILALVDEKLEVA